MIMPVLGVPKKAAVKKKSEATYDVLAKHQAKKKAKLPKPEEVARTAKLTVHGVKGTNGSRPKSDAKTQDTVPDDNETGSQSQTRATSGGRAIRNSLKGKGSKDCNSNPRALSFYKDNQHLVVNTAKAFFRLCLVTTKPWASTKEKGNMARSSFRLAVSDALGSDVESDSEDIPPLTDDLVRLVSPECCVVVCQC
jgi:hypothetical protein